MSGRSLVTLADGRVTTYRKTLRRNPRRDPRERLRELVTATAAGPDKFQIRLAFRLPQSLEGFTAPGQHGFGVQVLAGGFVRIGSHSGEQCFVAARELFAGIARERPAFTTVGVIVDAAKPADTYSRYLTVIAGTLVVSAGGLVEPRIYETA